MSTLTHTVTSGTPPFILQINPGALCTANCTHSTVGSPIITTYNSSALTLGVNASLTFTVTDGNGCVFNHNFTHCCPTTGGSITGASTPNVNVSSTYSLGGITGTHTVVWSLIGGAGNSITASNSTQATVNVGTSAFTLRATITDCSGNRAVNFSITPTCTLAVSSIVFSCI